MFNGLQERGVVDKEVTIDEWKEKDLSTCIVSGDPECAFQKGTVNDLPVAYLCGQEEYCMLVANRKALEQAKRNADLFFPVVGVLEELNTTLALLEHKLPSFFAGASHLFYDQLKEPHRNRNPKKPEVTKSARKELDQRLAMEKEFYMWVKRRLHKQFEELLQTAT